ncbi:MAG: GntR family transcriptional regulator, partial [Thermomicrobium sp.]
MSHPRSGNRDQLLPKPIVRRVLREEIKEYLIDAILRRRLAPGDRIIETRIAQELGVSQTPVREALRDLELLGFVTSEPFRGTRVRAFTHEELVQIYPIRAAIEGVAARAAATRISTEQLLALDERPVRDRDRAIQRDADRGRGGGRLELVAVDDAAR